MPPSFASRVIAWQARHGRHGLPWHGTRDAYRIWLSEVMLQQTQVATVLPYFERFIARFPTVSALAQAPEGEVMALWSGLGYYARARNLHRAAREVVLRHAGVFPRDFESLAALPGVGRSTAGAIAAFASGERRAILDGNVRRVLARHAALAGDPGRAATLARLWQEAEARLPVEGMAPYTQGLMDLGATVCVVRAPRCHACPVAADCAARLQDRVQDFPSPRKRIVRPLRTIGMAIVLRNREVLLEKRPPTGLWGGLWSLPELEAGSEVSTLVRDRLGVEPRSLTALEPFTHAFTHFTLQVTPWRVEGVELRQRAREERTSWLPLADLAGAALPSPVKKLLLGLDAATAASAGAGTDAGRPRARRRR